MAISATTGGGRLVGDASCSITGHVWAVDGGHEL
jgi:hypothetical protein